MPPISARIDDVAEATGLGKPVIYQMIADGRLRCTRIGGTRLIYWDSVLAALRDAEPALLLRERVK